MDKRYMEKIYNKINEAKENNQWMVVIDEKLSDDERTTLEQQGYKITVRAGKFDYSTIMW